MRRRRDYTDYLRDMLEFAGTACDIVQGVSFDDFGRNREKMLAVVRALETIGEAAKNVSPGMRRRCPEVPWRDIVGMRNKLIHQYFGVDLQVVWKTVHEDLPPLRVAIARMLQDLERDAPEG